MQEDFNGPAEKNEVFAEKFPQFLDELASRYNSEVGGSILVNPSLNKIKEMVVSLESNKNFGIRGTKLYNAKTNEVVLLVWPADGILHYKIQEAVKKVFRDFTTKDDLLHTFQKRERPDFPGYQSRQIVLWMEAPVRKK